MAHRHKTDSTTLGKSRPKPLLLSLAAAMEGRPLFSDSVLFSKLPIEVLYMVIGYLDREALAKLATLNSDCRQLARTWQFRSWSFDYQDVQRDLSLLRETNERAKNNGKTSTAALGACINTVSIAMDDGLRSIRQNLGLNALDKPTAKTEQLQDKVDAHFGSYIKMLERTIKGALPNLHSIRLKDEHGIPPSLLKAILTSPARTLDLGRVYIDDTSFKEFSDDMTVVSTRLDALTLKPLWDFGTLDEIDGGLGGSTYPFVCRLLQYCGSGLKFLCWDECVSWKEKENCSLSCAIPPLVELRKLILSCIKVRSRADAESLILPPAQCRLTHLELQLPNTIVSDYMKRYTEMPTLKALSWDYDDASFQAMEVFVRHNRQLERLACQNLTEDARDMRLLPMLASTHHRLLSLEVGTNDHVKALSETVLAAIAQMKTLRKLHLSAGVTSGWQTDWLVDHRAIRKCVGQLPDLKVLALSRDTYDYARDSQLYDSPQAFQYERYYTMKYTGEIFDRTEAQLTRRVDMNDPLRFDMFEQWAAQWAEDEGEDLVTREQERKLLYNWKFEMIHRRRILKEANRYVNLRYKHDLSGPRLEMLYLGQLPIEIVQGWWGKPGHGHDRAER